MPDKVAAQRQYDLLPGRRERQNVARRVGAKPEKRDANRRRNLLRYGVTVEQYDEMLAAQGGRCAICGEPPDPYGRGAYSRLHVDHNHATGGVRSLLCGRCNQGLGYFLDDPERLLRAATYLKEHAT